MSDLKLISPLLDGFIMGPPISSHHGVRCCPAMKQNTDSKYIVKIISVPASQTQLDALLLTGAYKDPGDAMDYFKSIIDETVAEAEFLEKVSKLEGFLPYENFQVVPMEDNRLGYLVYLLGSYKRSLEKYMRRNSLSHADALKVGIDICGALAVCRRAGAVYVALKPANIFVSDDNEFRIGDLGFVPMDSLKYTALAAKFRSPYCPPEVLDPMQTLNETVDTYALGMILYQIYNNGNLPVSGEDSKSVIPSPVNAGEDVSAVILKAIDPKPENRWESPAEMGRALGACFDNGAGISDPVTTPTTGVRSKTDTQIFSADAVNSALNAESAASDTRVLPTEALKSIVSAAQTQDTAQTKVLPAIAQNGSLASDTKVIPPVLSQKSSDTKVIPTGEIQRATAVAVAAEPQADASYDEEEEYGDDFEEEDDLPRVIPEKERRQRKPIKKGLIAGILVLILLAGLAYGAFYYYSNYYLQTIESMRIEGMHDSLTVVVDTQIDESLLTVSCTDTYGNAQKQQLSGGKAEFSELRPNSQYKIVLEIEGFHQLVGKTSDVFNTESRTEIVSFTGITGSEDGSVLLTFTVDGPEPEKWIVSYTAEGEEPLSEEFSGHSVTVRNLSYPKNYTFTLSPSEDIYVTGQTTLSFDASPLVLAQNLTITSCEEGRLTVCWDTPETQNVESWSVHCYSDAGYDQTVSVTGNEAVFEQIDTGYVHYVEVTASGMTQPARTSITKNPLTISSLSVDEEDPYKLTVSWDFKGESPDGGWLLMYSMDGTNTQSVVKCEGASAEISPRIHGAEYKFVIQAADSTSIFQNVHTYSCPEASPYKEHSFDPSRTVAYLIVTPDKENWTTAMVSKNDYTDTFSVGQPISIVLFCDNRFYIPEDSLNVLYVIRNSEGQVISKLISQADDDWHDLWVHHNPNYAELDLPTVPTELGSYSLSIYFDGMSVASTNFTIVE